jgi:hypothetical protein
MALTGNFLAPVVITVRDAEYLARRTWRWVTGAGRLNR